MNNGSHLLINFKGDLIDFFEQKMRGGGRVVCPSCGYEWNNYIQTGRLGCSKCFDIFHDQIAAKIRPVTEDEQ